MWCKVRISDLSTTVSSYWFIMCLTFKLRIVKYVCEWQILMHLCVYINTTLEIKDWDTSSYIIFWHHCHHLTSLALKLWTFCHLTNKTKYFSSDWYLSFGIYTRYRTYLVVAGLQIVSSLTPIKDKAMRLRERFYNNINLNDNIIPFIYF